MPFWLVRRVRLPQPEMPYEARCSDQRWGLTVGANILCWILTVIVKSRLDLRYLHIRNALLEMTSHNRPIEACRAIVISAHRSVVSDFSLLVFSEPIVSAVRVTIPRARDNERLAGAVGPASPAPRKRVRGRYADAPAAAAVTR
jgi:hypothetical protein